MLPHVWLLSRYSSWAPRRSFAGLHCRLAGAGWSLRLRLVEWWLRDRRLPLQVELEQFW